ncbi:hypothetical protein FOE78_13895 [Microlunatus elymi]|uniref:TIGR02611 family protein n=1 Tax=Microlunatus elymi TaxID=2596828 RepID=A0A516Q093_9ACTN|nr:PGPGW domain-containing protein [Microlunatus elymi]QDP96859.1 hypothetical protein FOE78_13895 [Microlunatus elymi]
MSTGDGPGRDHDGEAPAVEEQAAVHPHRHPLGDHHVLIDRTEDRWEWRRKIRADPRKLHFYRIAVAIAGVLLILLGAATGPLPGPGGIPLVLLGLAVWASEFEWAHRLMQWFKRLLQRFRTWSRPRQVLAWVIFFAVIGALGYGYLLVIGMPVWMPGFVAGWLHHLPGV